MSNRFQHGRTQRSAAEMVFAQRFGDRLRQERMGVGLSVKQFARLLSVVPSTVEGWERGDALPNLHRGLMLVNFYLDRGVPLMAEIMSLFGAKAEACLQKGGEV